ncbi:MAG: hypothetical protein GEU74_13320 [Nitriliruptorales bacterium]|nr:hypothetical protein [Nitriliruptorales bacterium]
MARILVVANITLAGDHLTDLLRRRMEGESCSVHVLVPASPNPTQWIDDEMEDVAQAQARLHVALQRFSALGCDVDGEIGEGRPVDAVGDILRREQFDEIIISTLPVGPSRWLRADVVSRLQRAVDIPVTHVVGTESLSAS